jgi:hypothetical protein
MTRRLVAFVLFHSAALAETAIQAPSAGCLLGADGALRPVHGIAGAFLAGAPAVSGVISAACSNSLALVKTADALEVRDGSLELLARWDAPGGTALFALPPTGQTGFVYYETNGELLQVDAQSLPRAVLDSQSLGGQVLAIASPDLLHLIAVVADSSGSRLVRISATNGAIESETPLDNVTGPEALLGDGTVVFADGADLVIRPPHALIARVALPGIRLPVVERHIALPAPAVSIGQMGPSWLALRLNDSGAPLAVRIEGGTERTCRVPAMETAP